MRIRNSPPFATFQDVTVTTTNWCKQMQFLAELNGRSFAAPSSKVFADAVKHYREAFAPRMLRTLTFSVADGHLKTHLEPDWNNVPVSHITIDAVNEWAWKKRKQGLSWVTVRTFCERCSVSYRPPAKTRRFPSLKTVLLSRKRTNSE